MKKYREMNLAKPVCIFCRAESPVLQTVDPNLKSRKYEDHGFSSEISGSDVLGDKKRGFRVDLHNEYMFNSSVVRKKGPKKSMTNLDTSKVVLEGKFPSLAFSLQSFKKRRHSV